MVLFVQKKQQNIQSNENILVLISSYYFVDVCLNQLTWLRCFLLSPKSFWQYLSGFGPFLLCFSFGGGGDARVAVVWICEQ